MKQFPSLPVAAAVPDVFDGHLWLQELVDGGPLRFRVDDRGFVFGDDTRVD